MKHRGDKVLILHIDNLESYCYRIMKAEVVAKILLLRPWFRAQGLKKLEYAQRQLSTNNLSRFINWLCDP